MKICSLNSPPPPPENWFFKTSYSNTIVKSSLKALKAKSKEALENTVMRQLSKKKQENGDINLDAAEGTNDIGKFLDQEKYVLMFIYIIQSFKIISIFSRAYWNQGRDTATLFPNSWEHLRRFWRKVSVFIGEEGFGTP